MPAWDGVGVSDAVAQPAAGNAEADNRQQANVTGQRTTA
eukprot:CAMPEP_0198366030 /NCGR_PEP_ID=MMETSP1450-20131203/154475_1 /TAXON_ID=753684 ORGANISM="Madagascaria erythrocladiodes, Strain CCMP3234" /NCGR_SAMPLE_ID=MMETSP1450 /ASSEMBLY_ACC=CAM_ASM_001115 /LENGTH=38 /DNA_ID= /DNA_START= /DNA_END= /DNA_ORIENTATION=